MSGRKALFAMYDAPKPSPEKTKVKIVSVARPSKGDSNDRPKDKTPPTKTMCAIKGIPDPTTYFYKPEINPLNQSAADQFSGLISGL